MSQTLIYVTAPDREEALGMARALVDARLVACATVLGGATSVFRWEGERQEAAEVVMIAKTTGERREAVIAKLRELHSYDLPCILSVPLDGGNREFLDWIETTVGK